VARRRTGDYQGAEQAYRQALEVDPRAASAYQNLGALLKIRGRSDEADRLLALSRSLDSRNPFLYLDLGDVSVEQGRLEEAERLYRRALRLDERIAESHAAMGLLFWRLGRRAEAERWLKRAEDRLTQQAAAPGHIAGASERAVAVRVTRLRAALRPGSPSRSGA
jgi:tetratricopeptide (TPR) repeat protein